MKNGYYIGDFEPSAFKTKNFEVAYVKHKQNDKWVKHYHKIITEINFVMSGKVRINDQVFVKGDIFVVEPHEIVERRVLHYSKNGIFLLSSVSSWSSLALFIRHLSSIALLIFFLAASVFKYTLLHSELHACHRF